MSDDVDLVVEGVLFGAEEACDAEVRGGARRDGRQRVHVPPHRLPVLHVDPAGHTGKKKKKKEEEGRKEDLFFLRGDRRVT